MIRNINTVLLWGSLWGLIECTLGYILHAAELSIGYMLWFPISYYILSKAYKETGSPLGIIFTSLIASGIKLTDLLLPSRIDKIINPAVSIILEGFIVFALYTISLILNHTLRFTFYNFLCMSFFWRILYITYMIFMPQWMIDISPIRDITPFCQFLFLESILNAVIIYFLVKVHDKSSNFIRALLCCSLLETFISTTKSLFSRTPVWLKLVSPYFALFGTIYMQLVL